MLEAVGGVSYSPRVNGQRRKSAFGAIACIVAVGLVGACSDGGDDPGAETTAVGSETPEPTPTSTDQADKAAALDVFEQYWDVYVAALSGPDPEVDPFIGLATDEIISQDTTTAQTYADQGIVFTGEPVLSDTAVEIVEPGVAHVSTCVDESDWVGTIAGEPLPKPTDQPAVHAAVYEVRRQDDGSWLVGTTVDVGEDVQC